MTTQAPRQHTGMPTTLLAATLALGLLIGFTAGQLAPHLVGAVLRAPATQATVGPALGLEDDYATRHASALVPSLTLGPEDDYATRHASALVPSLTLGPEDDYATRH